MSSGGLLKVATLGPSGDIVLHFELIIASMPIGRIEVHIKPFRFLCSLRAGVGFHKSAADKETLEALLGDTYRSLDL